MNTLQAREPGQLNSIPFRLIRLDSLVLPRRLTLGALLLLLPALA